MGFVFAVASILIVVQMSSSKQANAQSAPDIMGNCVDLVIGKLGNSTWCKFFDNPDENCSANQLYGKGAFENAFAKQQAKYQVAYNADGYSKPPPPGSVTILDSSNKPISGSSNAVTFSRFSYRGQSYTSKAQNVVYFVYDSTFDSSFKLLLTLRPSGDAPLIIGLVNTGNNSKGGKVPVCAYNINKNAILSTSTGAPIENTADVDGDGKSGDACFDNGSGWSFSWIACPLLKAADELTTFLVNNFEEQLAFNVSQLGSTNDPKSGSYKIHQTWSLIKNIASALVVIVMLIMVLSQAISVGPFDAYTVRKLLPRLVAVVILMQISWPLFTYVIDIVNNLGRGIADIMYLPFGGADNMDLWSLLNNAELSQGALTAMSWGGLVVFGVLGVAFLFTMLGLAFMAIIALLFAWVTLIFRKILIITLLIFAPLALLAWTLPGTEKYWKLWRENFLKILMMFPIIMAIIGAGRVFAYVVGTPDTNKFTALIFIMVGFFGPLFLLPRTFKWGGQAMNLAGERIMGIGNNLGNQQKKFMESRQQGWSAERKRRSQERYSKGEGFNWSAPWRRPIDLVRSGQVDPTLWGRRKRQAMDAYVAQGVESEDADIKAANTRAQRKIDLLLPDDQDTFARELAAGNHVRISDDGSRIERDGAGNVLYETDRSGRRRQATLLERRAGLDQITRLGGEGNIEVIQQNFEQAMASKDREQIEMMNSFKTAQAGTLFKKLPHIYKNPHYFEALGSNPLDPANTETHSVHRTVEGIGGDDITQLSGTGFGTMVQTLRDRISANPADTVAQADLSRLLTVTHQALTDPATATRVPPDVARRLRNLSTQADVRSVVGDTLADNAIEIVNRREGVAAAPGAPAPVPPTAVPATRLDTPDSSGWTPRDQAYAENATRDEYNIYRNRVQRSAVDPAGYPPLTPEEQRRLEQIRGEHPDW